MKKSLLALAALTAFTGAVSAQSNVTMYGRVDLSVNRAVGTDQKAMTNGSGSRLGLRGSEDLGGGMAAIFNIEHRFNADTGVSGEGNPLAATTAARFWGGRSLVGLKGNFGQLTLGREYTTAFLGSQLINDPWGWDTVVSGTPGRGLNQALTAGGIGLVRNDSAATYNFSMSGFSFGAQIAEATDAINNFQKKPYNFSAGYAAGPFTVNAGYEKTGQVGTAAADWATLGGTFNLGVVKLGASFGTGKTFYNAKNQSMMLTAVGVMGQGELRASVGKLTSNPAGTVAEYDVAKGFALGYHYALSKRTTIYADMVRNTGDFKRYAIESAVVALTATQQAAIMSGQKTGYDFGIKHNF